MNLASIEICELGIPFRFRYGHASARHQAVQSILLIARDSEGREGYGEAVPRTYVTGETTASVRKALPPLIRQLCEQPASFTTFRKSLETIEDRYPQSVPACAICALETACTDLAAQQGQQRVVDLLGGAKKSPLIYTASIGMGSRSKLVALLLLYRAMGLRHFKVKVGDTSGGDLDRLRLIRRILGSDVSIFADANGAWDRETAAQRIEALSNVGIWAMEEPLSLPQIDDAEAKEATLTDRHYADNAWLQERSSIPLIADESLISLRCAQRIIDSAAFKIFNIRLSKCGGYQRSSQFAEIADQAGLSYSLGAMVGESPVLAMAGAAWAASHPRHLYVQGHSHRVLHGERFVNGCPPLRRGGAFRFDTDQPIGAGLGIDRLSLDKLATHRETIDLP